MPAGKNLRCFFKALYPRLLKEFLKTAFLKIVFGAIKEILVTNNLEFSIYLKLRVPEFIKRPLLNMSSIIFLSALLFLGSIVLKETKQRAWRDPFFAFAEAPFDQFWF